MAFNAGYCDKHLETIGVAISHKGFAGPWNLLAKNSVLKNTDGTAHKCEDPYIWRSKRGWHLLVHNQEGPQKGSASRRRDCHLMAPPCTFIRCFNRNKQGVSSK